MAINVTCDGTTYPGVETITAGGKTFALSQSGGAEIFPYAYVKQLGNMFYQQTSLPETVVMDLSGFDSLAILNTAFLGCSSVKYLTIKNLVSPGVELNQTFMGATRLETLTFENCSFPITVFTQCFRGASALQSIVGELDLSGRATSYSSPFMSCTTVTSLRIKKDTIIVSPGSNCFDNLASLDNASVVSIANGLSGSVSGQTITFATAVKNKLSTILGTVADGVFTEAAGGNVTLSDFITNTKGWTVG